MRLYYIFAILLLLICTVPVQVKANTGKNYLLGVYVLCDEHITKKLRGRNIAEYFGAFFNVINLIFQQLPGPKVTFKVASIETTSELNYLKQAYRTLPVSESMKPYLYGLWSEHFNITKGDLADTPTTNQLSEYFKKAGEPYNNSHVIVLFSGGTLLLSRVYHDRSNSPPGKDLIVHRNPRREGICTDQNIVITQDDGFFSGIMLTARRLTRLLGANYDLAKNTTCLYSSGMLMGDISQKENFKMSPCTVQDLKNTLELDSKQYCLGKIFNSSVTPTQKLPANLFNTDRYCAHKFKGKENAAECKQSKWDISGYPYLGTCQVGCCYGPTNTWRRIPLGIYYIDAPYGYACKTNGREDGACIKQVCVKKSS